MENRKTALFMAHPGHELRIYHWLEKEKPITSIFTDGSGSVNESRLHYSESILDDLGIAKGPVFGRWTDRSIYTFMLEQNITPLVEACREIAEFLLNSDINLVVGDAVEGYNTTHDLCRYVLNAAVKLAELESKKEIKNYDFLLAGHPNLTGKSEAVENIIIKLDEAAFERKIAATKSYLPLAAEVEQAVKAFGEKAFSCECLRVVQEDRASDESSKNKPYYEIYCAQQVAAKKDSTIISFEKHLKPLVKALWQELGLSLTAKKLKQVPV